MIVALYLEEKDVVVKKGRRITAKHAKILENASVNFVSAPLECQSDRERIHKIFNLSDSIEIISLLRRGDVDSVVAISVRVRTAAFAQFEKYMSRNNKT